MNDQFHLTQMIQHKLLLEEANKTENCKSLKKTTTIKCYKL